MLTAASITQYWDLNDGVIGAIFYVAVPVLCIVINSINVKVLTRSLRTLQSSMKLS